MPRLAAGVHHRTATRTGLRNACLLLAIVLACAVHPVVVASGAEEATSATALVPSIDAMPHPLSEIAATPSSTSDEFVRLQCYFEDERQMVLLRKSESYADLLRKLREQFDADEGGLIIKYEEDGELFGLKSQDNLIAALRGFDHSQSKYLNLFIWPKPKPKQAPITIVLGDSEHHTARSSHSATSEIPLWVPTLTSSLGFVALIVVAIISAGSAGLEGLRKIGSEEELTHADWLHIFKTQSSQYWPSVAECATYFSLSWLAILVLDVDLRAIHWHTDNQLLPCLLGFGYGILVPYTLYQLNKLLNMLKRRSAERRAREEAERRARILRLKASKRPGSVPEGSVTDSESESEDAPSRAGSRGDIPTQTPKEPPASDGPPPSSAEQQQHTGLKNSRKPQAPEPARPFDVPALVINVAHEISYVLLSNALYFTSCYYWTGSVAVSCIGSQLLSIAAREFMEGIITIGIGMWVYLFIAYFSFIPSFLVFVSAVAWFVINILAPTKPRYDYIALMLFTDSLPCSLCAAAAWATYRQIEKHLRQPYPEDKDDPKTK